MADFLLDPAADTVGGSRLGRAQPFPTLPLALLAAGVALISFAPLLDALSVALSVAVSGLLLLTLAVWRDRRRAPRLFPRAAFRLRTQQGRAIAAKITLGASAMSILVFGPLLLFGVFAKSATFAGAFVLIETVSWCVASFFVVSVPVRTARRIAAAGPAGSLAVGGIGQNAESIQTAARGGILVSVLMAAAGAAISGWALRARQIDSPN